MIENSTTLKVRKNGGILRCSINKPPLNLLTQVIRAELGTLFNAVKSDATVRCVIWESGEQAFCAGADLKEFSDRFDPNVALAHGKNAHRMILALMELDTPVIASLRGACMGGGLELALACTYRIAGKSARLGLPEVNRGVWPGTGGVALLTRLIGPSASKRLLYTGEVLNAQEALALGIVDEVVEDELLDARTQELAFQIAQQPAASIRTLTELADHRYRDEFREHLKFELERFVQAYQLPDAHEGYRAFFEKRVPCWQQDYD
ncbi:enoyl-CoA hydratase/isomerase family protein [Pollutimonas sp. H1-120]|uniref:enoyl-CoA hydratase/isomerase family protein n=1 Tax=Pollutimonas sp. H1-120 TaxID=3148824 RepID=UPI003B520734